MIIRPLAGGGGKQGGKKTCGKTAATAASKIETASRRSADEKGEDMLARDIGHPVGPPTNAKAEVDDKQEQLNPITPLFQVSVLIHHKRRSYVLWDDG